MSPLGDTAIPYPEMDYAVFDSYAETPESCGKKHQVPSKRRVKFAEEVQWVQIRESEITAEEKGAVWYNSDEYHAIKVAVKTSLKRMKDSEAEDESHCYRGLEGRTRIGHRTRQHNKKEVLRAVLTEQQFGTGNVARDTDMIAMASMQASISARKTARGYGERDERCAVSLYTDWALLFLQNK